MVQNNVLPPSKRASKLLGKSSSPLVLKVEGTERDGQIIRVHAPKCLVGSDAGCQLRLIAADVQPKHCVIYRGQGGMIVKSWTRDTRINGNTISEAWLRIGDRLSLGSLSFEILEDEQAASPNVTQPLPERKPSSRALRKRTNRRIRSLLDVVRQQKDTFSDLQAKFDETQKLVDSLLAKEADVQTTTESHEQLLTEQRIERRKQSNRRVRTLLNHVRDLITSNSQLQAELREQLEIKQNQITEIRQELVSTADASEEERAQRRRLEATLKESEATVSHLKEQSDELQSRAEQLRERWLSTRKNGKTRVKSILSHLREMRDQVVPAEETSESEDNGAVSRLTELRLAYDDASRELQENRDSLKHAESELAWSQEELEQREQLANELQSKIAELEQQLSEAHQAQPEGASPEELAQHAADVDSLRHQLEDATLRGDDLKLQLDELREQNVELQKTIHQQKEIEENWKQQLEDARQQCLTIRRQLEEERRIATPPTAADSPEEVEEHDSAIDHLRSMGILRETPEPTSHEATEPEEESPAELANEKETPNVNPVTGLTSFPNFQFPEEEQDSPESDYTAHESPSNEVKEDKPAGGTSDDDISIDDYMQNLLARMRAKTGEPEPAPQPKKTEPVKVEKSEPEPEPEPVRPITREEFIPSRNAPEQTSDIRKLRELANETAKAAIDSATINRWETLCKSKMMVSLFALAAGFTLHYLSTSYLSVAFAGACMAYVITVFWWLQSAVIYQHVKSNRKERMDKRFKDEIINPHGLAQESEPTEEEDV